MLRFLLPFRLLALGSLLLGAPLAQAQTDTLRTGPPAPGVAQKDMGDVLRKLFPGLYHSRRDTTSLTDGNRVATVLPTLSYSLQTGVLLQLNFNVALRRDDAKVSTLASSVAVTQKKQAILSVTTSLWTRDNHSNWFGDYRLMHYPQRTYGLGMHTRTGEYVSMNFNYLRFYQIVLHRLEGNLYGGLGYQLDNHWGVDSYSPAAEVYRIGDYQLGVRGRSISSGVALMLLYDSRDNSINPQGGAYAKLHLRPNFKKLGSDSNYQTLQLEGRKYLHPNPNSRNILALWSYNLLTLSGTPPYLDLPATGWDTYADTGRGYIQGRFRGKNLLYAEAEYRYGITRNGLLGGVVFTNVETVSEPKTNRFDKLAPAAGVGLRLNIKKASHSNLAIDYGIGIQGSKTLSFNVGEVF